MPRIPATKPTARRARWLAACLLACAASIGAAASPASANTIAVTNLNDAGAGSLRQAIETAAPNDTITVPAGQITLTTGPLAVAKNLTISGAGSGATTISGNDASRVFTITASPVVTLSGMKITHGKDVKGAGLLATGEVTLVDVAVTANHAGGGGVSGFGGGVALGRGSYRLIDSSVTENTAGGGFEGAGFGGGLEYEPPGNGASFSLSLTRSRVSGNQAGGGATESAGFGGGISASSGFEAGSIAITLASSVVSNNVAGGKGVEAAGFGGGLELSSGGAKNTLSLVLERSAVTGNAAGGGASQSTGFGGGIDFVSGGAEVTQTLTSSDTTISANSSGGGGAVGFGGGVLFGTGTATFSYDTIAANSAGGGGGAGQGGGLEVGTGAGSVSDSILAANAGGNCATPLPSGGNNIDDGTSCGFAGANDRSGVDAKLGPLGDHGGLSPTQIPLAGSPAIDRGNPAGCTSADQRGVSRPQAEGCDIGAVELVKPSVATGAASGVSSETATVGGSIDANFSATSYHVDYGTTTAYGNFTAAASAGEDGLAHAVSATLSKLKPNTFYHYRLVASNAEGTVIGGDATLTTRPAQVAFPVPLIVLPRAPGLGSASLTNTRFRVGRSATAIVARRAPVGTRFRFKLSTAATVQISIARLLPGLRKGHSCLAPSVRLRRAHAKHCTRALAIGKLTRASQRTGLNSIAFSGRIGKRALAPGEYRAVLSASNGGGRSIPVVLKFTVVR